MTVLGLDGTEVSKVSKFNTFCSLCSRRIFKGELARTWEGKTFLVHEDCEAVKDRLHNVAFRRDIKKRSHRKRR